MENGSTKIPYVRGQRGPFEWKWAQDGIDISSGSDANYEPPVNKIAINDKKIDFFQPKKSSFSSYIQNIRWSKFTR